MEAALLWAGPQALCCHLLHRHGGPLVVNAAFSASLMTLLPKTELLRRLTCLVDDTGVAVQWQDLIVNYKTCQNVHHHPNTIQGHKAALVPGTIERTVNVDNIINVHVRIGVLVRLLDRRCSPGQGFFPVLEYQQLKWNKKNFINVSNRRELQGYYLWWSLKLATPYGNRNNGQHWLRLWLGAVSHSQNQCSKTLAFFLN